jgi:hypothetical protein
MPPLPGGAAPAEETARILEIADALLADETVWDPSSIRTDDPVNGRYTLYSALATACHEVTGRYSQDAGLVGELGEQPWHLVTVKCLRATAEVDGAELGDDLRGHHPDERVKVSEAAQGTSQPT